MILVLLNADAVWAQIPGSLIPGRQDQAQQPPPPKSTPGSFFPKAGKQTAPNEARQLTFLLKQITLEGAKSIPFGELEKIWHPYLNKTVSIADLYEIANAITAYYSDKGYALSFAFLPEQRIHDGKVTLRVVEGFVDHIIFKSEFFLNKEDPDQLPEVARNLASKILRSKPLKTSDLERYLLLINDLPGIRAAGTFSPSKDTPNGSTLTIQMTRKLYDISLSTNNYLPSSLRYWTEGLQASSYHYLDSIGSLQFEKACGLYCNTYSSTSLSWTKLIGSEGAKLIAKVSRSDQSPQEGILSNLEFDGTQTNFLVDASYPLLRSRHENFYMGSSFEHTDNKTEIFTGTLTQDKTRTLGLYASYDRSDATDGVSQVRIDLNQGLPIMNATEDNDPLRSRDQGSATFSNFKIFFARNQPLYSLLPSLQNYSLYFSGSAQRALASPLLSASQCFYGGRDMGRGYNSGTLSGDHCLMGSIEIRRDWQWRSFVMQSYGFGDAGAVWQKGDLLAGESRSMGGQSAGAGIRLFPRPDIQTGLELAVPLRQSVAEDGKGSPRLFFSLNMHF